MQQHYTLTHLCMAAVSINAFNCLKFYPKHPHLPKYISLGRQIVLDITVLWLGLLLVSSSGELSASNATKRKHLLCRLHAVFLHVASSQKQKKARYISYPDLQHLRPQYTLIARRVIVTWWLSAYKQWGVVKVNGVSQTFPLAFATRCFAVVVTANIGSSHAVASNAWNVNKTSCIFYADTTNAPSAGWYYAIGV